MQALGCEEDNSSNLKDDVDITATAHTATGVSTAALTNLRSRCLTTLWSTMLDDINVRSGLYVHRKWYSCQLEGRAIRSETCSAKGAKRDRYLLYTLCPERRGLHV